MNGNVNDVTGNGHNGTAFNLTAAAGQSGLPNTAYSFNGTSSYISVPYQADLNLTQYSICAVYMPKGFYTGLCQVNAILRRGSQYMAGYYALDFYDNAFDSSCSITNDTNKFTYIPQIGNTGCYSKPWDVTPYIRTGQWECVVATFDGNQFKVYVNGTLRVAVTPYNNPSVGTSTQGLAIGAYRFANFTMYPYWLNGIVDDVALYNRALTPAEVATYCNAIFTPDTSVSISQPVKPAICAGDSIHLKYSTTLPFNAGNIFTAQLSNNTGSFAAPVSIGSVTATTGGTIICTIPGGTTPGTGYRIRIVASSPADTSLNNGVNIIISQKPNINASSNSPVCAGDTLKLSASAGTINYQWSGPASITNVGQNTIRPAMTAAMAGIYTVIASGGGCSDTATTNVSVLVSPVITFINNKPLCIGDSLTIIASTTPAASIYSWKGPGGFTAGGQSIHFPNATLNQAGYYVLAAGNGTCTTTDSVLVQVNSVTVNLGKDTQLCPQNILLLNPGIAGAGYVWQDNSTDNNYNVTTAGKYYVTVTQNGCKGTDTINVTYDNPSIKLGNDTTLCPGEKLVLVVADTFDLYTWNTGSHDNDITLEMTGSYILTVVKNGCSVRDTIRLDYYKPDIKLSNDSTLCNGDEMTLRVKSIQGSIYTWQNNSSDTSFKVKQAGKYWVTAENLCGKFSDTVVITYEQCECNPVVPTGFSPNGDGLNDEIGPKIMCVPFDYEFIVANRWGQIVFKSDDPTVKWKGTREGRECDMATYYYILKFRGPRNKTYERKGDITLVR
jgi:gliding motility-associated-like protein